MVLYGYGSYEISIDPSFSRFDFRYSTAA